MLFLWPVGTRVTVVAKGRRCLERRIRARRDLRSARVDRVVVEMWLVWVLVRVLPLEMEGTEWEVMVMLLVAERCCGIDASLVVLWRRRVLRRRFKVEILVAVDWRETSGVVGVAMLVLFGGW
jgi:hypothetical protein